MITFLSSGLAQPLYIHRLISWPPRKSNCSRCIKIQYNYDIKIIAVTFHQMQIQLWRFDLIWTLHTKQFHVFGQNLGQQLIHQLPRKYVVTFENYIELAEKTTLFWKSHPQKTCSATEFLAFRRVSTASITGRGPKIGCNTRIGSKQICRYFFRLNFCAQRGMFVWESLECRGAHDCACDNNLHDAQFVCQLLRGSKLSITDRSSMKWVWYDFQVNSNFWMVSWLREDRMRKKYDKHGKYRERV